MKKYIINVIAILLLTLLVFILVFTSCYANSAENDSNYRNDNASMFVYVEHGDAWNVVYNKYTKVMYAVSYGGRAYGIFTLLVNADGSPMIYDEKFVNFIKDIN